MLKAIKKGRLSVEDVDRAVGRILRIKFRLGLFENPFVDVEAVCGIVGCQEHRRLAREVARQSLILLKNENDILP